MREPRQRSRGEASREGLQERASGSWGLSSRQEKHCRPLEVLSGVGTAPAPSSRSLPRWDREGGADNHPCPRWPSVSRGGGDCPPEGKSGVGSSEHLTSRCLQRARVLEGGRQSTQCGGWAVGTADLPLPTLIPQAAAQPRCRLVLDPQQDAARPLPPSARQETQGRPGSVCAGWRERQGPSSPLEVVTAAHTGHPLSYPLIPGGMKATGSEGMRHSHCAPSISTSWRHRFQRGWWNVWSASTAHWSRPGTECVPPNFIMKP